MTLQSGSGSYDLLGELGFTKALKTSRLDAYINYQLKAEGAA